MESETPSGQEHGRFVAFYSRATNLAPGATSGQENVYLRNRRTGKTELVSVSLTGKAGNGPSRGPSVSADGRFVLFGSEASDLVAGDTNECWDAFVRDRALGRTTRVNVASAPQE